MNRIELNHAYKCRHCSVAYAILPGCNWNSFLPVELRTGEELNDNHYDKEKHISHLLNCPGLQAQWESVKKMIIEQLNKKERLF